MTQKKLKFIILIIIFVHCETATAAQECSGHGQKDDGGVCVCDNSWPLEAGISGWVGEDCQIPAYLGSPTGNDGDMAESCFASTSGGCTNLNDGAWVCFANPSTETTDWNHLSLLLQRTGGDGDPDLYGFMRNHTTTAPSPNFSAATGFDFQDTSTKSSVNVNLNKADFEQGAFDGGYYACVHNYPGTGSLTFSLQAIKDVCSTSFSDDGVPLVCSTPRSAAAESADSRFTECTSLNGGTCVCKASYAAPVENVYPNLGFENCAAKVTMIFEEEEEEERQWYVAENEHVNAEQWSYWGFNTTAEVDYEVRITVIEKGENSRVAPFVKFSTPPGAAAGQFDERAAWNAAPGEREHHIVLDSGSAGTRSGLWFVGVFGGSSGGDFELTLQKFKCPGNCSSNGVCEETSHECRCSEGYAGEDCSIFSEELTFNSSVTKSSSAVFEYEYFKMPEVTAAMMNGSTEVKLTAVCSSALWNIHIEARPEFLLNLDDDGGGVPSLPTATNFTHRVVLDLNRPHSLILCSSQLVQGSWWVALHNPLPSIPLNYTFSVGKIGRCLNDCSAHGECTEDGQCVCEDGWAGGDCSASSKPAPPPPPHHHPFWHFIGTIFTMGLGAVAALVYISFRGMPAWLPNNNNYFSIGMYQELVDGAPEGI